MSAPVATVSACALPDELASPLKFLDCCKTIAGKGMTLLPVTSYAVHTVQVTPGQQTVLLGSGLLLPLWLNTGPQREAALAAHAPARKVIWYSTVA